MPVTTIITILKLLNQLSGVGVKILSKIQEHQRRKKRVKAHENPRKAFIDHFSS